MSDSLKHPYSTPPIEDDNAADVSSVSSNEPPADSASSVSSISYEHPDAVGHSPNSPSYTSPAAAAAEREGEEEEVRWWRKGPSRQGANVYTDPVQGHNTLPSASATSSVLAGDRSPHHPPPPPSGKYSDNSGSDADGPRHRMDSIPPPTPPRSDRLATPSGVITAAYPAPHPYASELRPPSRRADSPSPVGTHQRTSSVASNHSDRPPRHPSEERNMAAVWVDLPPIPTTLPVNLVESHRRRTPRSNSGPPSPATSTLAASISSNGGGEHGNGVLSTKSSTLLTPAALYATSTTSRGDRIEEADTAPSVSSVSGEVSPSVSVQLEHDATQVSVSLTPPSSVTAGRQVSPDSSDSPSLNVSESLLKELLSAYNSALSEIHTLKGEVSKLKRELATEKTFRHSREGNFTRHPPAAPVESGKGNDVVSSASSSSLEGDLISMENEDYATGGTNSPPLSPSGGPQRPSHRHKTTNHNNNHNNNNSHPSPSSNNTRESPTTDIAEEETLKRLLEAVARAHRRVSPKKSS